VEEASAAAGSLEEQSQALTGAVAVFRLDGQMRSLEAGKAAATPSAKPAIAQKPSKAQQRNVAPAVRAKPRAVAAKPQAVALKRDEGWQEF